MPTILQRERTLPSFGYPGRLQFEPCAADELTPPCQPFKVFKQLEIEGEGFGRGQDEFAGAFAPLARRHKMDWHVCYTDTPKRIARYWSPAMATA